MGDGGICSDKMSGIATSLSRYTPISNSPFNHSLNLGTRFLLGGRIVTPASRTVALGRRTVCPGDAQVFIWMDVGPACHSSSFSKLRPVTSRARPLAPSSPSFRQSPSCGHHTSIPCASIVPSTSSTFPNPQPGFSRPESPQPPPVTIGARLKLAPPSIRLSGHPPPERTAGMDSW